MKKSKMLKVIATILMLTFMIQMVPFSAIAAGDEITEVLDPGSIITEIPYDTTSDENPETKEIVSEETAKRSENEKHFKLEDGSFVIAQYPDAVHYEDENGNWIDIDNTLIAEEATDANDFDGYTNKDNDFNVKLAEDGKDQLLRIEEGDFSISMKLDEDDAAQSFIAVENNNNVATITDDMSVEEKNDQTMQLDKLTSKAEYSDILPGIDIEYTVQSNGVKEYIVVNERRDEYVFSFELELGNLVVRENEDGSISLMADDGEEMYVIPAPYMFDATEQYSDTVSYAITNIGSGKYTLTVTADGEWINNDETILPVKIDPTIITKEDVANITCSYVTPTSNSIANIGKDIIYVGNDLTETDNGMSRALIDITIPPISSSYVITNATLNLYQKATERSIEPTIEIREINTVRNLSNSTPITWPPELNVSEEVLDSKTLSNPSSDGYVEFNITKAFSRADTGYDYSFILTLDNEDYGVSSATQFTVSIEASECPSIEIYYQNQKGIDPEYSYIPIDCGKAGTAYVNVYNGDVAFIHNIKINDNISFDYVYTTYASTLNKTNGDFESFTNFYRNMDLGRGWKLSAQKTIVPITQYELSGDYREAPENTETQDFIAYAYNNEYGSNIFFVEKKDAEGNPIIDTEVFENGRSETKHYKDIDNLGYSLKVYITYTQEEPADTANPMMIANYDGYVLTTPDQGTLTFKAIEETINNSTRYVGYITEDDSNNSTAEYSYEDDSYDYSGALPSQISRIKIGSSKINFNYTNDTEADIDGTLSTIVLGRDSTSFDYSSTNLLYHIDNKFTGRTTFDYYPNGRLKEVIASDGNTLMFTYSGTNNNGILTTVKWKKNSISSETYIVFDFSSENTLIHYYGSDGVNGFVDGSTSEDDTYLFFSFDANGLCNQLSAESAKYGVFERTNPIGIRGTNNGAINDPNMSIAWYIDESTENPSLVATPYFDYNTNVSEMYANSSNTIALSEDSHNGGNSYAVSILSPGTSIREYSYLSKQVSLPAGTHTFEAYVKSETGFANDAGSNDNDNIEYGTISISWGFGDPEQEAAITSGNIPEWNKLTYTFDTEQETICTLYIKFKNGTGTVLLDDVSIDGRYLAWPTTYSTNGISDGFESGCINWETSSDYIFDRVTNTQYYYQAEEVSLSNVCMNEFSLKINGELGKEKSAHYTYYVPQGTLPENGYKLSGWGKASSGISEKGTNYAFELFAYYVYYVLDGTDIEMRTMSTAIPFDPSTSTWQYVSQTLNMPIAEGNERIVSVYSITFGALYKDATGNAYFDNLELIPVTE